MRTETTAVTPLQNFSPNQEQRQQELNFDFSTCQRMKKLTTHDIYRFTHLGQLLVVKLFNSKAISNYQTQLDCLKRVSHPSILKVIYHRSSIDTSSIQPLLNSHLLVMNEATRGDLNDYLPRYGKMNEKLARTYFKDMVESLNCLSQLKPPLIHPNLVASNLLLTKEGSLKICGWSQLSSKTNQERLRENVFSCGEILICFLTSFMPFYKKYSPTDTYFKFLTNDQIHKFWQQIQKKMSKIDKKFCFSSEVKDLLQSIFLKKFTKFTEILNHPWTKSEIYTAEQRLEELEKNQAIKNEKIQLKMNQQAMVEQKRKKDLHQHQISVGFQRSGNTQNQQFIKDCEQNMIRQEQIPNISTLPLIKIEATPSFIIASLKDLLRSENGKYAIMVCQQFVLSNYKVVKINNYVLIDLNFSITDLEQDEDDLIQPQEQKQLIIIKVKINFIRQNKEIYADVSIIESNFNSYYTNLALRYIQQRINSRKKLIK